MTEVHIRRRAGSGFGARSAVLLALLLACAIGPLAAQVPDSVPPGDTVRVPIPAAEVEADTLPRDSLPDPAADSLRPAPNFPEFPRVGPTGFAWSRREIGREELLRYRVLSLAGLLERVPGLWATRGGGFGTPAGFAPLGAAGGRLRLFRDGYEVDPFALGAPDLQQIGLIDLESVTVEQTPGEVRVHLRSFRLPDARPYSEVEIGAGNYDTKLLRAMLARTVGTRGVLSGSYDLATTDGATPGFREPFQFGGGRLAFAYTLRPGTALQAEFVTASGERGGTRFPLDATRQELVLRGRSELRPGLVLDLAVGRGSWAPRGDDSTQLGGAPVPTGVDTVRPRLESVQLLARAAYSRAWGAVEAGGRLRSGDERGYPTPRSELFAKGTLRPLPILAVHGDLRVGGWEDGNATETTVTAAAGPFAGVTAFASAGTGERWLGLASDTAVTVRDTVNDSTVVTRQELRTRYRSVGSAAGGVRLGAEWRSSGAHLGAALLAVDATTLVPFGIGFDPGVAPLEVESAQAVEVTGSLPVPLTRGLLRLDAWYARWLGTELRPYQPRQQLRAAVELHRVFFGGELEPTLRVENEYRGATLIPNAAVATEPASLLNLYLQIRIQDVRAFLLWENLLNNGEAFDVPGFRQPGQRIVYGGRWFFRN